MTHGDKPADASAVGYAIGDGVDEVVLTRAEFVVRYGFPACAVCGICHFAGTAPGDKPVISISDGSDVFIVIIAECAIRYGFPIRWGRLCWGYLDYWGRPPQDRPSDGRVNVFCFEKQSQI